MTPRRRSPPGSNVSGGESSDECTPAAGSGRVSILAAASMGVVVGRRSALVVSVDAELGVRDVVCTAFERARYSPDNVVGLADFNTFPTSGLYCWSGIATPFSECAITGTPWLRWDGQWRLLVAAEVATVAMAAIVERGDLPGDGRLSDAASPLTTVPVRQVAAALWGAANQIDIGVATTLDERQRVAG